MPAGAQEYQPRRPEESLLYAVVAEELETFLAAQRERGHEIPGFVEREFRAFLDCGVLARGLVRVHCDACGLDRVVGFSCKRRGFCASCGGRRMSDTAAHLVDRVLRHPGDFLLLGCVKRIETRRLAFEGGVDSIEHQEWEPIARTQLLNQRLAFRRPG